MAASGATAAAADAAATANATGAGKGPFLWRVEGRTPTYLFGTIHVPDDRVLALPPSVTKAFAESTAVYTEIPMDAGTQMGVMGKVMLPDGTQLSEVIGDRLYNRMTAAAEKTLGAEHAGMGAMLGPLFQRMKPWAAMSQLSLLEFLPEMMAGKQPLDAMLYARAQAEGKTVGALETPDEQIAVFESFTLREQIRMLELTLDEIERVKPGDRTQTQQLIEAYLSGDMSVVSQVMEDAMAGDAALMSRFQDIAITKRNNHMTERILALRAPAAVGGVLRRGRHGPLRRPDGHRGAAAESRPQGHAGSVVRSDTSVATRSSNAAVVTPCARTPRSRRRRSGAGIPSALQVAGAGKPRSGCSLPPLPSPGQAVAQSRDRPAVDLRASCVSTLNRDAAASASSSRAPGIPAPQPPAASRSAWPRRSCSSGAPGLRQQARPEPACRDRS